MRLFILALFVLIFAAPAFAQTDDTEVCSVKIVFGSYASGIDIKAYEKMRRMLDESPEVDTFTDTSWGMEGERTLCVTTFSLQAADEVYEEAIDILPEISDKAWLEVIHQDGRSQKTQWPYSSPKNP